MRIIRTIAIVITATAVCLWGCSDDDTTGPPGRTDTIIVVVDSIPDATIQNIWPNDDKTVWTFRYLLRGWDDSGPNLFPTADDVPPVPTWPEIVQLLGSHGTGDSVVAQNAIYRIQFDSLTTTTPGVTAQNLVETYYAEDESTLAVQAPTYDARLLGRVFMARPDLRENIIEKLQADERPQNRRLAADLARLPNQELAPGREARGPEPIMSTPLLIHGGAWEKTADWIATYGELNTMPAWKFLTSDLAVGTEFTHQLVPDLANDVFLHARIDRHFEIDTELGTLEKAVDCLYVIDFGVSRLVDLGGNTLGYMRLYAYGRVVYVPTVGPVYVYERELVSVGTPISTGSADMEMFIVGQGVTPE